MNNMACKRALWTLLLSVAAAGPLYAQAPATNAPAKQAVTTAAPSAAKADATPAQRVQKPGLPHFGQISDQLFRGAQPKPEGFVELKNFGVDIVVNLREEKNDVDAEKKLVEAQGMRYVNIPMRGFSTPQNTQVAEFLALLRNNADKKVFVHCQRGAERTGVMVAAYRMSWQQWTPEQALQEMEVFRFRGFWFRHLKKYVRGFPRQLSSDPALQKAVSGNP
jgi:protein-tyrosine phosphatase